MAKFGIIAALNCEIEKYIADFSAPLMDNGLVYHGTFAGHDMYLTLCGVGKVNAAICTQRLIDMVSPDVVINSGVAGGVSEKLHICDLAISDTLTYHDFHPTYVLEKYTPHRSVFPADEKLIELAVRAANEYHKTEPNFRYLVGKIISGDEYVEDKQKTLAFREKYNALCTEMEGAAVAHTAYANGIPFIVMRTISDNADENADMSFNEMSVVAAERVSFIVKEMIRLY